MWAAPAGLRPRAVIAVDLYDLVYDGGPRPVKELIGLDQIDELELRVAKLVALADIVSTAEDVDMARGTLNLLGETLWDHARAVRELVRSLTLAKGKPAVASAG